MPASEHTYTPVDLIEEYIAEVEHDLDSASEVADALRTRLLVADDRVQALRTLRERHLEALRILQTPAAPEEAVAPTITAVQPTFDDVVHPAP